MDIHFILVSERIKLSSTLYSLSFSIYMDSNRIYRNVSYMGDVGRRCLCNSLCTVCCRYQNSQQLNLQAYVNFWTLLVMWYIFKSEIPYRICLSVSGMEKCKECCLAFIADAYTTIPKCQVFIVNKFEKPFAFFVLSNKIIFKNTLLSTDTETWLNHLFIYHSMKQWIR